MSIFINVHRSNYEMYINISNIIKIRENFENLCGINSVVQATEGFYLLDETVSDIYKLIALAVILNNSTSKEIKYEGDLK